MQVFSLKEVFLMDIFLCLWVGQYCGEGFGGGLYIYIAACVLSGAKDE